MGETLITNFEQINSELVGVFNNVMWIEEAALKQSLFKDLSIKDMHTIEAISMYEEKSASEVARIIHITPSSMTSAIDKLVEKGYVERRRSIQYRRVVKLGLTHKGRIVYRAHQGFHRDMARNFLEGMSSEDVTVVQKAIHNLMSYLTRLLQK